MMLPVASIPDALLKIHQAVLESGVPQAPEQRRQMVEAGHPPAGAYQRIRSLYESLPYFASENSRFNSIRAPYNYSMLFPPTLANDFPIGEQSFAGALAWHVRHAWQHPQLFGLDYGGWALISTDGELVCEVQREAW